MKPEGGTRPSDVVEHDVLDEATTALDALFAVIDEEQSLTVTLDRVCQQAIRALPDATMASVSMFEDGKPTTAASTGQSALDIDAVQYEAGAGPCLLAATSETVVSSRDHDPERLWPEFHRKAQEAGVTSFLSAPLRIDSEYFGSLNLYSCAEKGFAELEVTVLDVFTTALEGTLRSMRRYLKAKQLTDQLYDALRSRPVIDQAKGILMAAKNITADEAFAELTRHSQHENIKLRDLAARFVAEASRTDSTG
ncbi:GAF domain-containing protein [Haloechinothrix alba]|uniref:GAF domain-containing protein n=1 Tax=Haloechinothrix alba TaxID=664784 RepID=A0A238ZD08_9PSEU|nr:GAF and ANTAR domain-containing protein [Haloechinothrix alba]SNR81160.1 GAF domain-containing protein [Haloechinothrix alba]